MRNFLISRRSALTLTAASFLAGRGSYAAPKTSTKSHGFSLLAPLALPPDFKNFPYVNIAAPKGGEVSLSAVGSFDSFNPFILRGTAAGVEKVWDTLMVSNPDEATGLYGHLAKTIEISADRKTVTFELRPEARFHDNTPVTAEDVVWTFKTLRDQGRPAYKLYFADVADADAISPLQVVFHIRNTENKMLIEVLGGLPALPKHWWAGRDFSEPLRDAPLGSGPYRIGHTDLGRTLVMNRVPDWWAADMPTGKGLNNFDTLRTEYFRDSTVALQAFKAGQVDFREENIAKDWATAYAFPARQRGLVKLEEIKTHLPTGMQGFAMNTRRPVFANRLVRQAMAWCFDFEWANKNLFYDSYTRTLSYFNNTDLACSSVPKGDELALLEPHRANLPPELFTDAFTLPVTDGSGKNREQLRKALDLCQQAGWKVRDRKMVDANDKPVSFEILLDSPTYERVALPYVQTLSRLGIDAHVRTVDPAQFQHLTDNFDFDMTMSVVNAGVECPGIEQRDYWSSASARTTGSNNICGVADPIVDELVNKVIGAPDYNSLLAATHALDRVLLWNWYMVPQWFLGKLRVAQWDRFGRPSQPVRTGVAFDSWWVDKARAAATDAARQAD